MKKGMLTAAFTVLMYQIYDRDNVKRAGPGDHAVYGVGLWPLSCWYYGLESRKAH